ncbi:MAG TPA: TetR/AcrR family transcriptional regulator [Fimbriimonas sp.]|nr:TetR/AcrR family transcriptional regulator [Fimbriimonas sp.]
MALVETQRSTRDLILDATDRLMARYGFRKTTVEDVAREAAVARRTIYTYFASKEELGLASIARVVESAIDQIEKISTSELPPASKLRTMLMQRVMDRVLAVQDYHHSLDELFQVVRPTYMARRKAFFRRERELLENVLNEGMASGVFEVPDSHLAAQSLLLATNAFLPYSLSVRELGRPEEIEARLDGLVEILIRGVLKR